MVSIERFDKAHAFYIYTRDRHSNIEDVVKCVDGIRFAYQVDDYTTIIRYPKSFDAAEVIEGVKQELEKHNMK